MTEQPATNAGLALYLSGVLQDDVAGARILPAILAIEAEAHEQGMLRQLERQIHDEQQDGSALRPASDSLSPEAEEYLRMRERGQRLPSRRELLQRLDDCEQALRDTEHAAALPPSAPPALDVERLARAIRGVEFRHDKELMWAAADNIAEAIAAEYARSEPER